MCERSKRAILSLFLTFALVFPFFRAGRGAILNSFENKFGWYCIVFFYFVASSAPIVFVCFAYHRECFWFSRGYLEMWCGLFFVLVAPRGRPETGLAECIEGCYTVVALADLHPFVVD